MPSVSPRSTMDYVGTGFGGASVGWLQAATITVIDRVAAMSLILMNTLQQNGVSVVFDRYPEFAAGVLHAARTMSNSVRFQH